MKRELQNIYPNDVTWKYFVHHFYPRNKLIILENAYEETINFWIKMASKPPIIDHNIHRVSSFNIQDDQNFNSAPNTMPINTDGQH